MWVVACRIMDPNDIAGVFYTMIETQFNSTEGQEGRCTVKVRPM